VLLCKVAICWIIETVKDKVANQHGILLHGYGV
jgi:hypothetical protein